MAVYKSSFTLSQDPAYTQYIKNSKFREDYPPWDTNTRSNICAGPLAAQIMHRDDIHLGRVGNSITRNEFIDRGNVVYAQQRDAYGNSVKERALRATTFKMFTDPAFNTGTSSNMDSYKGHPLVAEPSLKSKLSTTHANIPLGDAINADIHISDYRKSFTTHPVSRPKFETKAFFTSNRGAFAGDFRNPSTMYTTSSGKAHDGTYAPPPALVNIPLLGSNLPQGDRDKLAVRSTLHQETYVPLNAKPAHPTSTHKFHDTTFKLGSDERMFRTTFHDAFNQKMTDATNESKSLRFKHIQSSLPMGDVNNQRDRERTSTTTMRDDFPMYPNHTVNRVGDASRQAVSSVRISGEPGQHYYNSEMSDAFVPRKIEKHLRPKQMDSSIPLKYYEQSNNLPETKDAFRKLPLQAKDKGIHQNQRKTHIKASDYRFRINRTTHQTDFTPKLGDRANIVNHRLQYSSVPLHTLNQDI